MYYGFGMAFRYYQTFHFLGSRPRKYLLCLCTDFDYFCTFCYYIWDRIHIEKREVLPKW